MDTMTNLLTPAAHARRGNYYILQLIVLCNDHRNKG